MPKNGTPASRTSRNKATSRSATAGSPGPLEKKTPSAPVAWMSANVDVAGSTWTSMPRAARCSGVRALMPRSRAATVKRLCPTAGTTYVSDVVTSPASAAPLISGADSTRSSCASGDSSTSGPENTPTRIAPRSRRCRVNARVSIPLIPTTPCSTSTSSRERRERGAMRVGVFSGPLVLESLDALLERVLSAPLMSGAALAAEVTTSETYVVPAVGQRRFTVAAVDLGIKARPPEHLAARGIEVHVLPATSTLADIQATGADGVFFSNGPGDPAVADREVALLREVLDAGVPFFGICFGNQILGRALGFGTYKLKYGHRGINQPVLDRRTGAVEVTAHNHGFAVDAPLEGDVHTAYGQVRVSHIGLNDNVVEGLECLDIPAFSVQYHPEAAAGPHDSVYLFDRFIELMSESRSPAANLPPTSEGPA